MREEKVRELDRAFFLEIHRGIIGQNLPFGDGGVTRRGVAKNPEAGADSEANAGDRGADGRDGGDDVDGGNGFAAVGGTNMKMQFAGAGGDSGFCGSGEFGGRDGDGGIFRTSAGTVHGGLDEHGENGTAKEYREHTEEEENGACKRIPTIPKSPHARSDREDATTFKFYLKVCRSRKIGHYTNVKGVSRGGWLGSRRLVACCGSRRGRAW